MFFVLFALTLPSLTLTPTEIATDEDVTAEVSFAVDGANARLKLAREPRHGKATFDPATGLLRFVPDRDFHGGDRLRFEVTVEQERTTVEVPITVRPVNDPPVAVPLRLRTREEKSVDDALTVKDIDNDRWTFSLGSPPARGIATVDGAGRVTFTPVTDAVGSERFTIVVDDGAARIEAVVDVTIEGINDAPVLAAARIDGNEDTPARVTVVASDVDGDAVTFDIKRGPKQGTATIDEKSGELTFTPPPEWSGETVLTVRVSDGNARAAIDVPVRVVAVDDPPSAQPLSLRTREDSPVAGALEARDSDGDTLSFALASPPSSGTAIVDPRGKVTFTPAPDVHGDIAFVAQVTDGRTTVAIPVRVVVEAVNDAPTLGGTVVEGVEDVVLQHTLAAADGDGDPVRFELRRAPAQGHAAVERSGALTFTPPPDWNGTTTLGIRMTDGKDSADVEITVKVGPVDDPPRGEPLMLTTREDMPVAGSLLARDSDGDPLSFSLAMPPESGSAVVDPQGKVTFTPAPDAHGTVEFRARLTDGHSSMEVPVAVTIEAVNDPPTLAATTVHGAEDAVAQLVLTARDVDGDTVRYELKRTPAEGVATLDSKSGSLAFTPRAEWNGSTSLMVRISDGQATVDVEIPVRIDPVDDPPRTSSLPLKTREDNTVEGQLAAEDIDGDAITFALATPPPSGTAIVDPRGKVTFTPGANEHGTFSFVATANDGHSSVAIPVSVQVEPENDAPTLTGARLDGAEDTKAELRLAGVDVDGDPVSYELRRAPAQGTAVVDSKTGALTYAPPADWHGATTLVVRISDGRTSTDVDIPVLVTPVDDPPRVQPLKLAGREDNAVTGTLEAWDVDGEPLRFTLGTAPATGTAIVDPQGKVTFTPAADAHGTFSFAAVVEDGTSKVEIPVTVVLEPVNDAPIVEPVRLDGPEDMKATVVVIGRDVDGDRLTYALRRPPRRGEATIDAHTGALAYMPETDWNGAVSATVRVSDGQRNTDVDVPIVIAAVNDAPVVKPLRLVVDEDATVSAAIEVNDVDRDAIAFSIAQQPTLGEVAVDGRGQLTFRPAPDKHGSDRLVVGVSDGTVSVPLTVDVKIDSVNDAPVSTTAPLTVAEDATLVATLTATDVDGDRLRFRATRAPDSGGRLAISPAGELRWTPPANSNGNDRVGFEVDDGKTRTEVNLAVTVTPMNDPPSLRIKNVTTPEDTPTTAEATYADIDGDKLTFRVERQGDKSTTTVDGAGVVRVVPNRDATGKDTIVVAVDDGTTSTSTSFSVVIEPTSDPPVVREERAITNEDTVLEATLPASDPDGDPLTFQLTSTGGLGTATMLDVRTGRVSYVPRQDASGDDVVTFAVTDGVNDPSHRVPGRLLISVQPVNDAPVVAETTIVTNEDTPVRGTIAMTDVDGDAVLLSVVDGPARGSATVENAARGAVLVTPARDFHGELSFTVAATETGAARLRSVPAVVRVNVQPVNDAPLTSPLSLRTDEDVPVSGQPKATDIDRDVLRWSVTRQPAMGSVTMDAQKGSFTYTPRKNIYGADFFIFAVDDGAGGTASARVDVTVRPADDPPVGIPGELVVSRNGRAAGRLLGRDPEGDALSFRIVDPPTVGTLKLLDEKTGDYAFSITGGTKGKTAPFRFVVDAGGKTSEPTTVVIRIE
jgi:hypothetical protein